MRSALAALVLVLAGLVAWGQTFQFYQAGNRAVGFFTNLTGQEVNGLVLEFAEPVALRNSIGVGGNLITDGGTKKVYEFSGNLVPYGTWVVEWPWEGAKLVRAAWLRDGEVVEEIDVHAPTARFIVSGNPVAGKPLEFAAYNSRDPDGGELKYIWEWDDGVKTEGFRAARTFSSPGKHHVTLTVIDSEGKRVVTKKFNFKILPHKQIKKIINKGDEEQQANQQDNTELVT